MSVKKLNLLTAHRTTQTNMRNSHCKHVTSELGQMQANCNIQFQMTHVLATVHLALKAEPDAEGKTRGKTSFGTHVQMPRLNFL